MNRKMVRASFFVAALVVALTATASTPDAAAPSRWKIATDQSIVWDVAPDDAHKDFIEMGGEQIAFLIRYGVDARGVFSVSHSALWPLLRFNPNLTHSHLRVTFGEDTNVDDDIRFSPGISPAIHTLVQDEWIPLSQRSLKRVQHKGVARFEGTMGYDDAAKLSFRRAIFPSIDKPVGIDTTVLTNISAESITLSVDELQNTFKTSRERGVYGAYEVTVRVLGAGVRTLKPGESTAVSVVFEAHKEREGLLDLDIAAEERARAQRVADILAPLQLQTPDLTLDTAFAFAKIRAAESLIRTKGGLMHAPGNGTAYYAAIWANDQAEYANPFFAMLGDRLAAESAINSFHHFARFMNPDFRPIPSSIIAEGDGYWNGAGDRGDMAMIAYGAARFALAYGDKRAAEELWPLIEWSLEFLRRKVTAQGVVASDSDELEGRFPAGKINLSTSTLYYDALRSAAMLGGELGKSKTQLADYAQRATAVRAAIERYFGANVEGFATYRYYDKADLVDHPRPEVAAYAARPDVLRAWIALPLTMDIFDRKAGTIDALFSPRLWTVDGLATEAGQITFWDRSTLYALRGVLAAGDLRRGMSHLQDYSRRRLLGDHVPYAFEAYPEGGKAQLSAESALYCRIFTEGLFGLRPTGLRSFNLTPRLPEGWPSMALNNVHAFGSVFDLRVTRAGGNQLKVQVDRAGQSKKTYTLKPGATVAIKLN